MHTRQTLTAVHDKSSAWLGLGSALASLWQQISLPTATTGVLYIAGYLLNIFVLHITVPGLFHLVPYSTTILTHQPTVLANASYLFKCVLHLCYAAYNYISCYMLHKPTCLV